MNLKLSRLRELRIVTEAISNSKALGVVNDIKVKKLGKLAKDRIDSEIGDDLKNLDEAVIPLRQKHEEVARKETTDDAINAKFRKLISEDEELIDITKTTNELWNQTIQFDFIAPVLKLKGDEDDKFSKEPIEIEFNGNIIKINAYAAFLGLIEDGFLTIE